MADINARDTKLIQYLNEAYGNEKRLETALEAHIAMTTRAPYRKRLQDHLKETKAHGREVAKRIRALGGTAEPVSLPGPDAVTSAATRATEVAQKAAALAQGPLHAIRGTGEAEKQLKNAKTEYQSEAEEIATYIGIEALANAVGDKETAKVARAIRREEERMAAFLSRLIPTLTKAVAQEEIPAAERNGGRRRSTSKRSGTRSTARKTTARKTSSGSTARKTSSRSTRGRPARAPRRGSPAHGRPPGRQAHARRRARPGRARPRARRARRAPPRARPAAGPRPASRPPAHAPERARSLTREAGRPQREPPRPR